MKALIELEAGECRFPFGEENFTFCGKQTLVYPLAGRMCQSSYCRDHHLRCIQPLKENTMANSSTGTHTRTFQCQEGRDGKASNH